MTTLVEEFLIACEVHSPTRLRAVLDAGFDVRMPVHGVSPVTTLLEMYYRSDAFAECLSLLLEAGAELEDPRIAPVLLNDAAALRDALARDPALLQHRTSLRCAFTPLGGATLRTSIRDICVRFDSAFASAHLIDQLRKTPDTR